MPTGFEGFDPGTSLLQGFQGGFGASRTRAEDAARLKQQEFTNELTQRDQAMQEQAFATQQAQLAEQRKLVSGQMADSLEQLRQLTGIQNKPIQKMAVNDFVARLGKEAGIQVNPDLMKALGSYDSKDLNALFDRLGSQVLSGQLAPEQVNAFLSKMPTHQALAHLDGQIQAQHTESEQQFLGQATQAAGQMADPERQRKALQLRALIQAQQGQLVNLPGAAEQATKLRSEMRQWEMEAPIRGLLEQVHAEKVPGGLAAPVTQIMTQRNQIDMLTRQMQALGNISTPEADAARKRIETQLVPLQNSYRQIAEMYKLTDDESIVASQMIPGFNANDPAMVARLRNTPSFPQIQAAAQHYKMERDIQLSRGKQISSLDVEQGIKPLAEDAQFYRNKKTLQAAPGDWSADKARKAGYIAIPKEMAKTMDQVETVQTSLQKIDQYGQELLRVPAKGETLPGGLFRGFKQYSLIRMKEVAGDPAAQNISASISMITAMINRLQGDTANIAVAERQMVEQAMYSRFDTKASFDKKIANLKMVLGSTLIRRGFEVEGLTDQPGAKNMAKVTDRQIKAALYVDKVQGIQETATIPVGQ